MSYDDAQAWQDNYDGMFARWAECDAERMRLKEELGIANVRLRIYAEDRDWLRRSIGELVRGHDDGEAVRVGVLRNLLGITEPEERPDA